MGAIRPGGPRSRALWLVAVALVVVGVGVLGTAAWQTWGLSAVAAAGQQQAAAKQLQQWHGPASAPSRPAAVPVAAEPALGGTVAVIRIPRFGASWSRVVRQGVDEAEVLDSFTAGVGHYPGTAMPGGVGNFAVAAHDTGWGDSFIDVARLRLGDRIDVRTAAGTYVYAFRNFQWVQPTQVDVLLPVPARKDVAATGRLITLTTCDPPYDAQERFIAYGTFVTFTPAAA